MSRAAQAVAAFVKQQRTQPRGNRKMGETEQTEQTTAAEVEPETPTTVSDNAVSDPSETASEGATEVATDKGGKKKSTKKAAAPKKAATPKPATEKKPTEKKADKKAAAPAGEKKKAGKRERKIKPQPQGKIKKIEPYSNTYFNVFFEDGMRVQCRTSRTYRDTLVKQLKAQAL
jgi:hypothetical protein